MLSLEELGDNSLRPESEVRPREGLPLGGNRETVKRGLVERKELSQEQGRIRTMGRLCSATLLVRTPWFESFLSFCSRPAFLVVLFTLGRESAAFCPRVPAL